MILKYKNGTALATGRVCKGGSNFAKVGQKETSMWSASLVVDEVKTEDGEYKKTFLKIKAWRKRAEAMPTLKEGTVVYVTGRISTDSYTANDGTTRTDEVLTIGDYDVCCPSAAFTPQEAYAQFTEAAAADYSGTPFDDMDDELPY